MARFRLSGLALTCVVAQLLAAPALGIMLQDDAALAEFHNHALAPWPSVRRLAVDPVGYFQAGRSWLSERIFPIQLATHVQKTVLVRWLNEPPEPRVSLGEDGHIFLNGGSNEYVYGLFIAGCVNAHSDVAALALERALPYWTSFAQPRRLTPDIVVIPTAASLYADKLPSSTPFDLRSACLERSAGQSPLLSVRPPANSPAHFVYPLREMLAAKDDPAFYPKGNWHAAGKSLVVARNAYLAALGLHPSVHETLRRGMGPAEILLSYGIDWERPRYFVDNPAVISAADRDARVRSAVAPLFHGDRFITHVYENTQPLLNERVLLLTDSFGDLASEVFAGAFRNLIQVNLNDLDTGSLPSEVIDRVRAVERIDRVILLIQEGNVPALAHWR